MKKIKKTIIVFCLLAAVSSISNLKTKAFVENNFDIVSSNSEITPFNQFENSYIPSETENNVGSESTESIQRSIIGTDDRILVTNRTDYPYSAVARVTIKFPDSDTGYSCSGAMVSQNKLLTNAHCVYNRKNKQFASQLYAAPAVEAAPNSFDAPFGYNKFKKISIPRGYINTQDTRYDFAIVELETMVGEKSGWFGITSAFDQNEPVTLTGYPGEKSGRMYTQTGHIGKVVDLEYDFYQTILDTTNGNSGSPVYTANNKIMGVNAINVGIFNGIVPVANKDDDKNYRTIYNMIYGHKPTINVEEFTEIQCICQV